MNCLYKGTDVRMNKNNIIFLLIALIFILSSCTYEYVNETPHSDDYNKIIELLDNQCEAMRRENITMLESLYAYPYDSMEHHELKKFAMLKFRTINTLECNYNINKIRFFSDNEKAELYMKGTIIERIEGYPKDREIEAPQPDGKNDFTVTKINGEWKFCPDGKCKGAKTEKISCNDGSIVSDPKKCPVLHKEQRGTTSLEECLKEKIVPEKLIPVLIGPFEAQQDSIKIADDDKKSGLTHYYESDYMNRNDNKELFQLIFMQASSPGAYEIHREKLLNDIKNFNMTLNGFVNNTITRDAQTINVKWKKTGGAVDEKFSRITNRFYIAVPEHNAFFRFNFNDLVLKQDGDNVVRTYFNNLCE